LLLITEGIEQQQRAREVSTTQFKLHDVARESERVQIKFRRGAGLGRIEVLFTAKAQNKEENQPPVHERLNELIFDPFPFTVDCGKLRT
jgi:hypothetical protein